MQDSLCSSQKQGKAKGISGLVLVIMLGLLGWSYSSMDSTVQYPAADLPAVQPVLCNRADSSIAGRIRISGKRKRKEPSAPRKIGIGMVIAACGFLIMALGSLGLPTRQLLKQTVFCRCSGFAELADIDLSGIDFR